MALSAGFKAENIIEILIFYNNMAAQNENQNDARIQMKILTDISLWKYLIGGQKKSPLRVSRVEAFYDLIDRQRVALLKGEGDYLKGSILEFAKAWGWDRETVTRFLDNLKQLRVLTIDMVGNRKSVRLNYVIEKKSVPGASHDPSEPFLSSSANDST